MLIQRYHGQLVYKTNDIIRARGPFVIKPLEYRVQFSANQSKIKLTSYGPSYRVSYISSCKNIAK